MWQSIGKYSVHRHRGHQLDRLGHQHLWFPGIHEPNTLPCVRESTGVVGATTSRQMLFIPDDGDDVEQNNKNNFKDEAVKSRQEAITVYHMFLEARRAATLKLPSLSTQRSAHSRDRLLRQHSSAASIRHLSGSVPEISPMEEQKVHQPPPMASFIFPTTLGLFRTLWKDCGSARQGFVPQSSS